MNKVEEFRTALNENKEWQVEVNKLDSNENIVNFAASKGYVFTVDEYKMYYNNVDELNENEMEAVAGGFSPRPGR